MRKVAVRKKKDVPEEVILAKTNKQKRLQSKRSYGDISQH